MCADFTAEDGVCDRVCSLRGVKRGVGSYQAQKT